MARSTQHSRSSKSGGKWLLLLVLATPIVGMTWWGYARVQHNQRVREENAAKQAEFEELDSALRSKPDPSHDPFATLDLKGERAASRSTISFGDSFLEQSRLCSDASWISAVEKSRQAYAILDEADAMQVAGDLDWRKRGQQGRELIQAALEMTEHLEAALAAGDVSGSLAGVRSVRDKWSEKDRQLHRIVGR